ncbi:GNAT family N-acetyltransferase [Micromonospora sp. CPCC 206060]
MTDDATITRAGVDDAGEILTVQRAAYVTEAQLYRDPHLPPLTETLAEVRAALVDAGTVVLAARLGNRLVGSVRARTVDGTCHIARLAVAPDQQGLGLGGRLLSAAEQAGRAAGATRFELFTGTHSEANLRLYRRHGFVAYDHRPSGAGPGLTWLEKRATG